MKVISWNKLVAFRRGGGARSRARKSLELWYMVVTQAGWKSPADVKLTFGKNVDFVRSNRGSELAVFNIHGNHYRLIAAVHYLESNPEKGRVYVLRLFEHSEYDKDHWKREL